MQNAGHLFACAVALGLACASPGNAATMPSVSQIVHQTPTHILTVNDRGYYDADEDDEDEGDELPPPDVRRDPLPPEGLVVPEFLPPPRPSNCGEYHYWNGAYCADARVRPPYVGPRW
jgi:hypothetical protein